MMPSARAALLQCSWKSRPSLAACQWQAYTLGPWGWMVSHLPLRILDACPATKVNVNSADYPAAPASVLYPAAIDPISWLWVSPPCQGLSQLALYTIPLGRVCRPTSALTHLPDPGCSNTKGLLDKAP